jgi:hypothetical protein
MLNFILVTQLEEQRCCATNYLSQKVIGASKLPQVIKYRGYQFECCIYRISSTTPLSFTGCPFLLV